MGVVANGKSGGQYRTGEPQDRTESGVCQGGMMQVVFAASRQASFVLWAAVDLPIVTREMERWGGWGWGGGEGESVGGGAAVVSLPCLVTFINPPNIYVVCT